MCKERSKYLSITKELWARPFFISGTEDVISFADYDGGDFGHDVIEMTLVDACTLTNSKGGIGELVE